MRVPKFFKHLKELLPEWNIRRSYRGTKHLRRTMIYGIPGPSYLPDPSQDHEHSLKLVVLLPTDAFEEYEISLIPVKLYNGKFWPRDPSFYARYGTDYISNISAQVIRLHKDTPPEEVAQKAAIFLKENFDQICSHFLTKTIMGNIEPKKISKDKLKDYVKTLATKGFEEHTPCWLEDVYDFFGDVGFTTSIKGFRHYEYGKNRNRPVEIRGLLTAHKSLGWPGDEIVSLACFASPCSEFENPRWPYSSSCEGHTITGMPTYLTFKLAALSFIEKRIKSRYRYPGVQDNTHVVWDTSLHEAMNPQVISKI